MAKYSGDIGFAVQQETSPGIWEDVIQPRAYKGDVVSGGRRWDRSDYVNDNFTITNRFSIISDTFLYEHIPSIRYVEYLGCKFKVTSAEIERPRVILTVGGVYVQSDETSSSTAIP